MPRGSKRPRTFCRSRSCSSASPRSSQADQSQRVAIGRAIVKEPKAFLFDEPLSNLDAELRVKMRSELSALHRRLGSTMIYVTHDQVEAMTMADTIVVLRDGVIEQVGPPIELYARPRNRFVACFLGAPQMNVISARAAGVNGTGLRLAVDDGRAAVAADVSGAGLEDGQPLSVGMRPEHLMPSDAGMRAVVEASEILGAETVIHASLQSGERIVASLRGIQRVTPGQAVGFTIDPDWVHVFDGKGDAFARSTPVSEAAYGFGAARM